jgi:hypothetical protein
MSLIAGLGVRSVAVDTAISEILPLFTKPTKVNENSLRRH